MRAEFIVAVEGMVSLSPLLLFSRDMLLDMHE